MDRRRGAQALDLTDAKGLLLLDLDGVVVFEAPGSAEADREILLLHPDLGQLLAASRLPTIILTHRSRREARQIVRAAGLDPDALVHLVAAEDLFCEAFRTGKLGQMLRGGLQKSLALNLAERKSGISRSRMAIIDDRDHNIAALKVGGVGLTMKAPSELSADGRTLTTFAIADALSRFRGWLAQGLGPQSFELVPEQHLVEPWRRSGLSTAHLERHLFNRLRRTAYHIRHAIKRRKP